MISFSRNKVKGKKRSPMRQLDDFPSNTRFTTALANLILAISSGWALRKLSTFAVSFNLSGEDLYFWSKAPFYLVLLHAIVSFITFGNPKYGSKLRWLHTWTAMVCVLIGLPCFVLQLACQHRVPLPSLIPIAAVTAFVGTIYQLVRRSSQTSFNKSLMTVFVLACLLSITLISVIHYNYYGLSAVFAYCINYFVIGMTGTAFNQPAIDLFSYGTVFFNYFAVKAILD